MNLDYRVAVVTGASSGIGAAVARRLAAAGVRVGLLALPDEHLEAETAVIRADGGYAVSAAADVADPLATGAALAQLTDALGPIDLLVLNAGIGLGTPAAAFTAGNLERMARVNLLGPAYAIEVVLPQMRARRRGHIVGVSSLSSYRGQPVVAGYCATKAALAVLLEGLRAELRADGIAVTTVRPGFVRTPMTAGIRAPRFMMEADDAARLILAAVAERRAEVAFPWQAAWLMGVARCLPCTIYDRLVASMMKGKIPDAEPAAVEAPARPLASAVSER